MNLKEIDLARKVANLVMGAERHFCPQYCGMVDRRRVIAFLLLVLCELLIIPYHIVLFLWIQEPWGLSLTLVHAVVFVILQYAIWHHRMEFTKGVSYFYLLIFAKLFLDSILSVCFGNSLDGVTVISNVFIMFLLSITALNQLLYKTSFAISVGMVPVVVFYLVHNPLLFSLFSLKGIFVGFVLTGYVAIYNMNMVYKGLRQPQRVSHVEQKALDMLANLKEKDDARTGTLMERLNPDLREHIIYQATEHLRKEEIEKVEWDKVCEDLTNSEKEICRLVLKGKTLKEICFELNKSESNITSQRCHIRKKLNLDRKDDLRRTLEMKIAALRDAAIV